MIQTKTIEKSQRATNGVENMISKNLFHKKREKSESEERKHQVHGERNVFEEIPWRDNMILSEAVFFIFLFSR